MVEPSGHCPYLGLKQNQAIRFASPTPEHRCYASDQAQEIPLIPEDYQTHYCLSAAHIRCPLYTGSGLPSTPTNATDGELLNATPPARSLRSWFLGFSVRDRTIYIGLLTLLLFILGIYTIAGINFLGNPTNSVVPVSSASPIEIDAPTATDTRTATRVPSVTRVPSQTATPSQTTTASQTATATMLPTATMPPTATNTAAPLLPLPPTAEPTATEAPTAEPPTVAPPTAEPPTVQPPTAEPPTAEPPTVIPTTVEPSTFAAPTPTTHTLRPKSYTKARETSWRLQKGEVPCVSP